MNSESSLTLDSKDITTINAQKRSKDVGQIVHVTSGVQPTFTKLRKYFLCTKK